MQNLEAMERGCVCRQDRGEEEEEEEEVHVYLQEFRSCCLESEQKENPRLSQQAQVSGVAPARCCQDLAPPKALPKLSTPCPDLFPCSSLTDSPPAFILCDTNAVIPIFTDEKKIIKILPIKGISRLTAKAVAVLLPILGSSWIFGILAVNAHALVFQYIFAVFNSLQGFFMFLFHCLLNSEVRAAFKHKTKVWSLTSSSTRNINVKPFNSDIMTGNRPGTSPTKLNTWDKSSNSANRVDLSANYQNEADSKYQVWCLMEMPRGPGGEAGSSAKVGVDQHSYKCTKAALKVPAQHWVCALPPAPERFITTLEKYKADSKAITTMTMMEQMDLEYMDKSAPLQWLLPPHLKMTQSPLCLWPANSSGQTPAREVTHEEVTHQEVTVEDLTGSSLWLHDNKLLKISTQKLHLPALIPNIPTRRGVTPRA
ncbi:hypothetical protein IHE44_0006382 [Lamprotornis superbus]|uniref:G-protein coupled receptors family 2 profile 2 domain-containing protein n=1 Tax=Lamprotornis superbus TaxID=245042 RepID=A0A835P0L3_9PASS|nr:hypothetical protein IHE44_0006382 [Lamprotornis superbus]